MIMPFALVVGCNTILVHEKDIVQEFKEVHIIKCLNLNLPLTAFYLWQMSMTILWDYPVSTLVKTILQKVIISYSVLACDDS